MTPDQLLAHAAVEMQKAELLLETSVERLLDVSIIAHRLNVTPATVRGWIRANLLAAVRTPTGRYRVPACELARILATRKASISKTPAVVRVLP
jgi:Helix-turn-helix domain